MDYESWVPEEAITAWNVFLKHGLENAAGMPKSEIEGRKIHPDSRIGFKLHNLRIDRAKAALDKIPELFISFANGGDPRKLWDSVSAMRGITPWNFICAVSRAYTGPEFATGIMTKSEKGAWYEKTRQKASDLQALVSSGRVNSLLASRYKSMEESVYSILNSADVSINDDLKLALSSVFSDPPLLSSVLWEVQSSNNDSEWMDWHELTYGDSDESVELVKPNDRDAHRAYFVRSMGSFFKENTGSYHKNLINILTSTLFGEIDRRKIDYLLQ